MNVSREMLQQHSTLKTIKKKLVRKALDMIRRIYEEDSNEFHESKNPGMLLELWYMQEQSPYLLLRKHLESLDGKRKTP